MNNPHCKFRCAIYMGVYAVNVYSNSQNIVKIVSMPEFSLLIPGYNCRKHEADTEYSLYFIVGQHFSAKLVDKRKTLVIIGSEEEISKGKTIPYMVHFLLEQERQKNYQGTMRGAGISVSQKGALLVGKRGSGKTSISLELCRKYGYSIIGNDLVIIGFEKGSCYIFDGTKTFTLRLATIKHHNTDLIGYFNGEKMFDDWTTKVDVSPERLGICIEEKPVPVSRALYVHLENDESAPFIIRRIDQGNTLYMGRHYLYEELSRYIRGVCIPVLKGPKPELASYLPSLDRADYHKKRLQIIEWIIEELGLFYISGPMKAICDYISQGNAV